METMYYVYFMKFSYENRTDSNVIYDIDKLYYCDIESSFICEKIDNDHYKIISITKNNDDKIKQNYLIEIFEGGMLSYNVYDEDKHEVSSGTYTICIQKCQKKITMFDNETNKIIDNLYSKIINYKLSEKNPYVDIIQSITKFYKDNNF